MGNRSKKTSQKAIQNERENKMAAHVSTEELIKAKGTEKTQLKMNGRDMPSCPKCNGYNAMLGAGYYDGVSAYRCRDCGYTVINVELVN